MGHTDPICHVHWHVRPSRRLPCQQDPRLSATLFSDLASDASINHGLVTCCLYAVRGELDHRHTRVQPSASMPQSNYNSVRPRNRHPFHIHACLGDAVQPTRIKCVCLWQRHNSSWSLSVLKAYRSFTAVENCSVVRTDMGRWWQRTPPRIHTSRGFPKTNSASTKETPDVFDFGVDG